MTDQYCSHVELKKNCSSGLIIYIVGSKADLHYHRQVTPDLARLSLHNWFPPPRLPTPPPPPPPQPSTLSYIRPRFTSFPGLRSPPATLPNLSLESPAYLDLPPSQTSGLTRSKTVVHVRPRASPSALVRANTSTPSTRTPNSSRFSPFGPQSGGWIDSGETSSNSIDEEDEDAVEEIGSGEWGLSKGMELFEVSAKDDIGTCLKLLGVCIAF